MSNGVLQEFFKNLIFYLFYIIERKAFRFFTAANATPALNCSVKPPRAAHEVTPEAAMRRCRRLYFIAISRHLYAAIFFRRFVRKKRKQFTASAFYCTF